MLVDFAATFDNPGALRMLAFVPPGLAPGAPLVVVLHGCTQTAAGYDAAAGWSALATAHGFALLFPEQVRGNNANGCFNWFETGDSRRGGGEAASIAHAVAAAVAQHRLDPARVFITGLSAGGAMANINARRLSRCLRRRRDHRRAAVRQRCRRRPSARGDERADPGDRRHAR